jgi:putative Holliday junction resolvase
LAVDLGSVRVGVARSDPSGLLAVPLETVPRQPGNAELVRLAELVAEWEALEVLLGLPVSLSGRPGPAAQGAKDYARELAAKIAPTPVRLVDERLSTVAAHRSLREAGVAGRRQRAKVDQAAAVVFLQTALDTERVSGRAPGTAVAGPAADGPRSQGGTGEADPD